MVPAQVKQHFKGVANSYSAIHDIHKYLARTGGGGLQARAEAEMAALLVEVSSTLAHLIDEHFKARHNPMQANHCAVACQFHTAGTHMNHTGWLKQAEALRRRSCSHLHHAHNFMLPLQHVP